jgi:sulfhydrogenase subunit gamma (sulfur reductase)
MLKQLAIAKPFEIYRPQLARIVRSEDLAEDHRFFQFRFEDPNIAEHFACRPGQFMMVSVIGTGEMPISISSSPTRPGVVEMCIRRVGRTTDALFRMQQNDLIGLRGPYGNGYPVEEMSGNNMLIVAGGLGMVPLRSLLWYVLDNRIKFKDVTLMYGCKQPGEVLFKDELTALERRSDIKTLLTVDADESGKWPYYIGVVTELFKHADVSAENTYAAVCGPPVVYKFVLEKLLERKFPKNRILMSLERRMKCGVGKCEHCQVGFKRTCIDGPIFTYWDAINMKEVI